MTILATKLLEGVHVFEGGEPDEVFTFPILHTQRKISRKPPIAIFVVAEHARRHVVGHRISAEGDAHGCPFCSTNSGELFRFMGELRYLACRAKYA